jgi:hypothetical protein
LPVRGIDPIRSVNTGTNPDVGVITGAGLGGFFAAGFPCGAAASTSAERNTPASPK